LFLSSGADVKSKEERMLKKIVCKKCLKSFGYCWTKMAEEHWQEQWVECPYSVEGSVMGWMASTADEPPDFCPYHLEHKITARKKEA